MNDLEHYMDATGRLARELDTAKQALAACAYWAANGLNHREQSRRNTLSEIRLENILKESKEYAESISGCDNNVMYDGFEYTYTPVGGWPDPREEKT